MMLKGKVVFITGGSRGIGKTIAEAFAKNGADIALNHLNDAEAEEIRALILKEGVRCETYYCDVSDFAASKEMVDKILKDFGRVDVLINNAGITRDGLIATMSEADFDAVININLKGAFNITKHLFSNFIRSKTGGAIINIASVVGLMGNAGQANYAAAKAGLIGLTKSTAKELGSRSITCNAIAPGFIESPMTAALPEEVKQKYLSAIPLKKFGSADNIAELAIYLANAKYITGEVIKIDGGLYI